MLLLLELLLLSAIVVVACKTYFSAHPARPLTINYCTQSFNYHVCHTSSTPTSPATDQTDGQPQLLLVTSLLLAIKKHTEIAQQLLMNNELHSQSMAI